MKKILFIFSIISLGFLLAACGPKEVTVMGYGIAHKTYVGTVELTVDKDEVVTSASIEEYFLPYNVAGVDTPAEGATDVVEGSKGYFAKYFVVGELLFIGENNLEGNPVYTTTSGEELLAWVAIEENAKAYVEGTQDGTVFIANADGSKHETYLTPEGDQWTKTGTNYGNDSFVWSAQVAAIAEALVGTKVNDTYFQNGDNKWVVGDFVSGATLVDFAQYYAIAERAYNSAILAL
jgi:hypothetical protein